MKAKFIKCANDDGSHNFDKSRWDVYDCKKLILSMTIDQIISGTDSEYDDVATVEFGKWLLKEIRTWHADV